MIKCEYLNVLHYNILMNGRSITSSKYIQEYEYENISLGHMHIYEYLHTDQSVFTYMNI